MAALPRKDPSADPRPEHGLISVKELLELPAMGPGKIIAGHVGIDSPVHRVNVMETSDIMPWVRPGDLLIATLQQGDEEIERFGQVIPEMARRGVAGLGIRLEANGVRMPPELVSEADKHEIPLLELPTALSLGEFVRSVMERVLAREASQLTELQGRIQLMSRLLLEGGGVLALLDALEKMLDNPVAVVRELDKPWLSESLRNAESAEKRTVGQSLASRMLSRGYPGGFVLLQNALRAYACPIRTRLKQPSSLVVLERNRDITPLDVLSLERLAPLAGLELANLEAVREVESKYLDQFLQDWLSGKIVSEEDWRLRAEVCGCALPEPASLCAVLVGFEDPEEQSPDKLREMARRLRTERWRSLDMLLAAPIGHELALIVPLPQATRAEEEQESQENALLQRLLVEIRAQLGDQRLRLFAGRPSGRPERLSASLAQARRAKQVASVCGLAGDAITYDRLGVYSLLFLIPSSEEREQFLTRFSAPLQQADKKGGGRLVETLEMFFRCNGNIKLTSERLYAHYNTVVYRLDKIQNILGVSLDDPEDRLQLQLSLKLGQITPGPSGTA